MDTERRRIAQDRLASVKGSWFKAAVATMAREAALSGNATPDSGPWAVLARIVQRQAPPRSQSSDDVLNTLTAWGLPRWLAEAQTTGAAAANAAVAAGLLLLPLAGEKLLLAPALLLWLHARFDALSCCSQHLRPFLMPRHARSLGLARLVGISGDAPALAAMARACRADRQAAAGRT